MSFTNNKYDFVVCWTKTEGNFKSNKEVCKEIKNHIRYLGDYTATIAVGKIYNTIHYVSQSYAEALEALNYKFIIGKDKDIYNEKIDTQFKNEFKVEDYVRFDLISAIKINDKKSIEEKLRALKENVHKLGSKSYLYMQMITI